MIHSKSKAWARASRTARSAKISRRVLKTKACMPEGRPWAMLSTLTRPSATAGKSYPVARRAADASLLKSYSPALNASIITSASR